MSGYARVECFWLTIGASRLREVVVVYVSLDCVIIRG